MSGLGWGLGLTGGPRGEGVSHEWYKGVGRVSYESSHWGLVTAPSPSHPKPQPSTLDFEP